MLMKAKERWLCLNPACGCQVVVEISGEIHGQNPRCACGEIMKKKYAAPSFSYLEFLRIDTPPAAQAPVPAPTPNPVPMQEKKEELCLSLS
jgi:hypothetical protein